MTTDFNVRSKYVPPMFFGDGSGIAPGDAVEATLDDVRVRIAITAVDGESLTGTVSELQDDTSKPTSYADLSVGSEVTLREEHVRACWKSAAA
ncbi:MAG TPA: hypothetical protein VEL07_20720 [Planctomycetota bacterium]|nr:hypothetical protein [Planctomycetota bacterium]